MSHDSSNILLHRDADAHYFCDLREEWNSETGKDGNEIHPVSYTSRYLYKRMVLFDTPFAVTDASFRNNFNSPRVRNSPDFRAFARLPGHTLQRGLSIKKKKSGRGLREQLCLHCRHDRRVRDHLLSQHDHQRDHL